MPVPAIVAGAAALAGRLAAKKVAKEVAKKATKKTVEKIAKNSVKVAPKKRNAMEDAQRISANRAATNMAAERKSGALAKTTASRVNTNPRAGTKRVVVQVKSGKDVKSAASSKRKLDSYTPNPGRLPNLIKIDSAKGNSVKKTAYRPNKRSSK